MSTALDTLADDSLVCIIFLDGDDYEKAVDAANENGGSTEAVVEHLSSWDYGDENDGAATINGYTPLPQVKNRPYHVVVHGGLEYWLVADHQMGYYALYRRPLNSPPADPERTCEAA